MKAYLFAALSLAVCSSATAECVTGPAGRTVCRNAEGQLVAAPPAAPVVGAPGAAVVAPGAAVAPRGVYAAPGYRSGVAAMQTPNSRAVYNARTGNAAVSHTNPNGVTTTRTARGGEAKTYNGMGVARGPGGTTCVKGRGHGRCN